jgi:hypothetical protein
MTRSQAQTPADHDASGPLIALCAGHRCEALHRLADDRGGTERVRSTVAAERGAVLVSSPCLGECARGAVAAVARRDGRTGTTGPSVWLGGVEQPATLSALLQWIRVGGPSLIESPAADVPEDLHEAMLGLGRPVQLPSRKP